MRGENKQNNTGPDYRTLAWAPGVALAARHGALAEWLAKCAGARAVSIEASARLQGGAVCENWGLEVAFDGGCLPGNYHLVLRTKAQAGLAESRTVTQEFAILRMVHSAGLRVPEPMWLAEDCDIIGRPFFIMTRVPGVAEEQHIVCSAANDGWGTAVAQALGEELARLHNIVPPNPALAFLDMPSKSPAEDIILGCREFLEHWPEPHPALEWGLRWLEANVPTTDKIVLTHRDFRTGNYLVENGHLAAILDWEFAGWSDAMEDVGWFCSKCWRVGAWAREAGGIASRASFYQGYERMSGCAIDPELVRYWEVMAHARWAVIALQQARRHLSGAESKLELALLGRRPAELEFEILRMTDVAERGCHA